MKRVWNDTTSYDPVLGIDARGNKYFSLFTSSNQANSVSYAYGAHALIPEDIRKGTASYLKLWYDITAGIKTDDENFVYVN